jgi:hypothetical protein
MTLNVLRGRTDFLELVQFCVPEGPLAVEHYYRFLDMGYKLTALAGSDFPWCGTETARIGNARFYVYTGGALTFESYMAGLKAGHTFATTGPMLFLTVNGKLPGDTLDVTPGTKLHVVAEAVGEVAEVTLVAHGKVLAKAQGKRVETDVTASHGMWIAARADGGRLQAAHTTPVYVTVNHDSFRNAETLARNKQISEEYLKEIEAELERPGNGLDAQAERHRTQLQRQIDETRAVLRKN